MPYYGRGTMGGDIGSSYQQDINPFFNEYMPSADFSGGIGSMLKAMMAIRDRKMTMAEAKRQFDMSHQLALQKQAWDERNTPAFQFGQLASEAENRFGPTLGPTGLPEYAQELFLKQFQPQQPPTESAELQAKVQEMVRSGGAKAPAEAYDKILKTGTESPNYIRGVFGSGARPQWQETTWNDIMGKYRRGDFGPMEDPRSYEIAIKYFKEATPPAEPLPKPAPPQSPLHSAMLNTAGKMVSGLLSKVGGEINDLLSQAKLQKWYPKLVETGGENEVVSWPDSPIKKSLLARQSAYQKGLAVMRELSDLGDQTKGKWEMTPALQEIIRRITERPEVIFEPNFWNEVVRSMPVRLPTEE